LAALIDSDHALDPVYARRCGIDSQQLYICQPGDAEQALSICSSLIKSGSFSAIAIDSATALLPLEEAALDYGASYAKYQQQLLDHAIPSLAISALTAVLTLKLHSALRLELINLKNIYDHGEIVGNRVQVKVAKNKFANSATPTRIDILYNEGIDCAGEILDLAVDFLICHRSGNSYFYGSQSLGDSRRSAKDFLLQNTAIAREIELAVRQRLFPGSREEYLEK
jgi:recombination protein RecA